ncbi:uncharacterized protein SPSC_06459 [Sporisorium scitamineum]|uniref:PITH domain-containing protein n=1 Tax=Sporisorium scitamineum TaxID=49012 RepID=A0A0F7S455_9BASI|nr:hypothetical protein [Sporisorium scitamineum]CDU26265.1 uncharacterized protein SPSC_06459 [Sporisorium scitamineum]
MSHHHSHTGPCGHAHHHDDDSHVKPNEGDQDLLYSSIDRDRVVALNETVPNSAALTIKTWERRADPEPQVISDADDQLIIHIPFTPSVKLSTFLFRPASQPELTPSVIKLYKNLPPNALNFDDIASLTETSKLESIPTVQDTSQVIGFPLQPVKWSNTDSITLFIESSLGADQSGIQFLGFKGKSSGISREAPTNIVYESAPQLKDHNKVGADSLSSAHSFGH